MPEKSLYDTLGIDRGADPAAVKRAYRKRAKTAHPDGGGSREEWAEVQTALVVLSNPRRREKYDRTGEIDPPEPDQTEAKATTLVFNAVCQAFANAEGEEPEHVNVIGDARALLHDMRRKLMAQIAESENARDMALRVAKRFKAKRGKPNKLRQMFDAQAENIGMSLALLRVDMEMLLRAFDILETHTWDWEAKPLKPSPFTTTTIRW